MGDLVRLRSLTAAALVALALTSAGCSGGDSNTVHLRPVGPVESDWVPGQPSLTTLHGFVAIEARAEAIATVREAAYNGELVAIQQAKIAAAKQKRAELLKKYEEAKRRAERLYQEALKRAARLKAEQQRKLAEARRKRAEELAALRRKLRVKQGEECSIPSVAAQFHCVAGQLPLGKPGKK
jgi:hypothetical protein